MKFVTRLATWPAKSGLPGFSTSRHLPLMEFLLLQRLIPSLVHLPCFVQVPPVGFKERAQRRGVPGHVYFIASPRRVDGASPEGE
jgi:hypothetical protein